MSDNTEMTDPNTNLNFSHGNRFYIFGDIDETIPEKIILPMSVAIEELSRQKNPQPIEVFISSEGGYLYYALDIISLFDLAKSKGIKVYTTVTSNAFSAGSLIAVCGHYRMASEHASYMLHFPRVDDYSHNPEMAERNLDARKFLDDVVIDIYKRKTKLKAVEKKLTGDNFFINGGKELLKFGMIDQII